MDNIPDHPVVKSLLKYGYPNGPETEIQTICPFCGKEAESFYISNREVFGCDKCLEEVDAYEWVLEHKEE